MAVTGPTASGKTAWAESFAAERGLELANADPFQLYREIPILGNQPKAAKNWHFLSDRSLQQAATAGSFAKEAEPHLKKPWLWVGAGLYLGALLYGLDSPGKKGTPFQGRPRFENYRIFVLNPNRQTLYDRIDQRVEEMIQKGAFEEAEVIWKGVQAGEFSASLPGLKAIGLRQLLSFFAGDLSRDRAIELWKQETRRLAKRQLTWLRKFSAPSERIQWIDL